MISAFPTITVVVAVLDRQSTLQRCIDSVAEQTYAHKELIVIDGGSTDGTVDILRANSHRIDFWKAEPDRGIYHAFNKGLDHAHGEWIHFLGSDDYLWKTDVLQQVAPHLAQAYPPVRIVYGQVAIISTKGELLEVVGVPWERARKTLAQGQNLFHAGVFHHRSLFEAHGRFNESFHVAGDYELLRRELRTGDAVFLQGIKITGHTIGGVSTTPTNAIRTLRETRRAQSLNGIWFPGWHWFMWVLKAVLRRALWVLLGEQHAKRILDWRRSIFGGRRFWTRL